MQSSTITVLLVLVAAHVFIASAQQQAAADCAQVLSSASHMSNEEKQTLCRLYQSSTALAQLGAIVTDSLERFMASQALTTVDQTADNKHLRFDKRKHEYLRFGRK